MDTKKYNLRPCPFCGERGFASSNTGNEETATNYWVDCPNLCTESMVRQSKKDGIEVWNTRPIEDTLQARIAELESENAALKSSAIVWHKYPDEKPEPSHEYEVNIPVMIATLDPISQSDFADYNIESENFWRYGTKYKGITHWAYLPAPPEGEE